MASVILLSLLVVATFVLLCYIFIESKIELDPPTIAAMEAHAEAIEARRRAEEDSEEPPDIPAADEYADVEAGTAAVNGPETAEPPAPVAVADYEYREMMEEGGENYVLPQWMVNYFSSSDICHTLDPTDNVVIIVKLNDARNADGVIDISADCDMSTQTIALKLCFGEGAAAEMLKTKFYLFERGDLFELGRMVRQSDVRIDVLTRAADYSLGYACTVYSRLSQSLLAQLKNVLAKIPA